MLFQVVKWKDILDVAFLVPLSVSLLALLVTYWTARIQNRTGLTSLFLEFSRRYNSSEMRESMISLANYYLAADNRSSFANDWYSAFVKREESARTLDSQRRLINRYYSDLIRLYRHKYVTRRFVLMAGNHYAINVYYKVVRPMNQIMFHGELQIREFEQDYKDLKKITRGFGNGQLTGEQPRNFGE
jgi:hypothetical protein